MSIRDAFITAVRNCTDLPDSVREAALTVFDLGETTFDSTYLEFLDQQIELNTGGDECSERLRHRRSDLTQWCDRPLIDGRVIVGPDEYTIRVDRQTQSVVHWEKIADIHQTGHPTSHAR